jgi:hypothetical protein
MIQTIGQNPMAIRRLEHHGQAHQPIANALVYEILFGWIAQDDELHILRQGRTGMNSFSLHLAGGYEYHFRQGLAPVGSVAILSSARKGKLLTMLTREDQARHWIRSLRGYRQKAATP